MTLPLQKSELAKFFTVRVAAMVTDAPLPCDTYVLVNNRLTIFRKRGDLLTLDRLEHLKKQGLRNFHIPTDQRKLYSDSLQRVLRDDKASVENKSKVLKETASLQMKALFESPDLPSAVSDTKILVENMVNFVSGNMAAVQSLMAMSMSDRFTFNHSVNVSVYAIVLAKNLYPNDHGLMAAAGLAGLLHDIGKRNVEPAITDKPMSYSAREIIRLREHPTAGEAMLQPFLMVAGDVKQAVAQHHEHYDGTGYPKQLSGTMISKLGRLIAIADVFDALTVNRGGQQGLSAQETIDSMSSMEGRFDPLMFQSLKMKKSITTPRKLAPDFDACHPHPLAFT